MGPGFLNLEHELLDLEIDGELAEVGEGLDGPLALPRLDQNNSLILMTSMGSQTGMLRSHQRHPTDGTMISSGVRHSSSAVTMKSAHPSG